MATSYSAQKAEEKKKIDQMVNKNIEQINKNYDAGIDDLSKKYDDQQRAVAVQKLINERKVAESMANLGVTDSGLNRTQQTAVQLSAANQAYNLNRQKQADINARNLERDNRIAEIEQSRSAAHMSVDDKYLQIEENAKAAQAQAAAEDSYIIKTDKALLPSDHQGTLASKGVSHYTVVINDMKYDRYVDSNTGNVLEIPFGTNPYTGTINEDIKQFGGKGAFENGYQPNNVGGTKLRQARFIDGSEAYYEINGYDYRIHTANGKFYIWNRGKNKYDEYTKEELKKKGVELK